MNFSIILKPHNTPTICLRIDDVIIFDGVLTKRRQFDIENDFNDGSHTLTLDMSGMNDHMLEIERISFEGISTDRMIWAGIYTPKYHKIWAAKQKLMGIKLEETISGYTAFGWDGHWQLNFATPIFTWIHHLEKLGWIYD
jgi:hypothetical protein